MARRGLWWLALAFALTGWMSARWLTHLLAAHHAHDAGSVLQLCGACVLMLGVLAGLLLGRPVLALGLAHGLPLMRGRAPRPPLGGSSRLRLVPAGPEQAPPSILACGHVQRAPPVVALPV